MDDHDFSDIESFLDAVRSHGIGTVIIAWQDEYGQAAGHETVAYQRLQRLTLLAYHRAGASVYRFATDGAADRRQVIRSLLEDSGFTVAERCRNIVAVGAQAHATGPRSR